MAGRRGSEEHKQLVEKAKETLIKDFHVKEGDIFSPYSFKYNGHSFETDLAVIPVGADTPYDAYSISVECGSMQNFDDRVFETISLFNVLFWIPFEPMEIEKHLDFVIQCIALGYYKGVTLSTNGLKMFIFSKNSEKDCLLEEKL